MRYGKIRNGRTRGNAMLEGTAFISGSGKFVGSSSSSNTKKKKTKKKTSSSSKSRSSKSRSSKSSSSKSSSSKSSSSNSSSASEEAEKEAEKLDWIERKIKAVEDAIKLLDYTIDATYDDWSKRQDAIAEKIGQVTNEIEVQQQAYEYYLKQANSVGLSDDYKNKIEKGSISIEEINDDDLKQKIQDYQNWYDKTVSSREAIESLRAEEAKLYKQRFENISNLYDAQLKQLEFRNNILNERISQQEAQGYLISTKYYNGLIANEQLIISKLEEEKTSLLNQLADAVQSGKIKESSQDWYDMCNSINDVTLAIEEANSKVIEFTNNIRDAKWELYDLTQDAYNRVGTEAEFVAHLFDDKVLYEKSGQLTKYSLSQVALYSRAYGTYMAQSEKYAEEIKSINKELANDPSNMKLRNRLNDLRDAQQGVIDSALNMKRAIADIEKESLKIDLENYREALEAEKDALQKAYDERKKMLNKEHENTKRTMNEVRDALKEALEKERDTFKDAIESEKDTFKDLIDEYKKALNSSKDNYDYQKNISEQAKEVANLQKQMMAYSGDDSEENKARLQKLRVNLNDAREELQQSEYDKFISDQTELLDNIYNRYEQMSNERLDAFEGAMEEKLDMIQDRTVNLSAIVDGKLTDFTELYDIHSGELKGNIDGNFSAFEIVYNEKTNEFEAKIGENFYTLDASFGQMMEGWEEDYDITMEAFEADFDAQMDAIDAREKAYADMIESRMNNIDQLFLDAVAKANANASDIMKTVEEETSLLDYEMEYSLEEQLRATGNLDNDMMKGFLAVGNILQAIESALTGESSNSIGDIADASTQLSSSSQTSKTTNSNTSTTNNTTKNTTNNNWGSWFIDKKDSYSKNKLDKDQSIVDRLKYFDFDSSYSAREKYYNAMGGKNVHGAYKGSATQNVWMIQQMKAHGYKRGTASASGGWAWTQEDGEEYIIRKSDGAILTPMGRGDAVLNSSASRNLYQFANNPADFMSTLSLGASGASINNVGNTFSGDISFTITLPNVENYEQFKSALQHDRNFEKMIRAMTTDQLFGGSSLKKYKY